MTAPSYRAEVRTTVELPDTREIRVQGRVTRNESPDLRQTILDELARGTAKRMIVELSHVESMDTSGAAVLAEALKLGDDKGVRIVLCSPSESVLRIFRLAGFAEVLERCCSGWEETRQRLLQ